MACAVSAKAGCVTYMQYCVKILDTILKVLFFFFHFLFEFLSQYKTILNFQTFPFFNKEKLYYIKKKCL